MQCDTGTEVCQILYQQIHSFDTSALKKIFREQITMERATSISVEVQLRQVSDKPDPERLDDKVYKKVLRKVFKMLEEAESFMTKVMDNANPLQIKIHIQTSYSRTPTLPGKSGTCYRQEVIGSHRLPELQKQQL